MNVGYSLWTDEGSIIRKEKTIVTRKNKKDYLKPEVLNLLFRTESFFSIKMYGLGDSKQIQS